MEALSKPKTVWIPSLHSVFATNDQHLIIALPQHAAAKRNETSERGNTLSDFSKRLQLVQQDQDCLLQSIGPYGKAWWIANSALVMTQNTCVFYVQVLIYRLAHNQRGFSSACFLFLDNRCLLLLKGALVCRGQILKQVLVWYCRCFSVHVRCLNMASLCAPEIIMKSMDHPNIIKLYETFASWQKMAKASMEGEWQTATFVRFCENFSKEY